MSRSIVLANASPRRAARRGEVPPVRFLALMYDAWRTRRILAELDPSQLKDIGVTRAEAQAELARAPWDFAPRR